MERALTGSAIILVQDFDCAPQAVSVLEADGAVLAGEGEFHDALNEGVVKYCEDVLADPKGVAFFLRRYCYCC